MPARVNPIDAGAARGRAIQAGLARDYRESRVMCGNSQAEIGRAVGVSASQICRFERGLTTAIPFERLAAMFAAVGLELSVRTYPAGEPLRDAAQLALLAAFREAIHPGLRWRTEVPLPLEGDLRAWDAVIGGPNWEVAVEAETRVRDMQAFERRLSLKQRDSGMVRVIVALRDSRNNREMLRAHADHLAAGFPLAGRVALADLAAARQPRDSAIVLIPMRRVARPPPAATAPRRRG